MVNWDFHQNNPTTNKKKEKTQCLTSVSRVGGSCSYLSRYRSVEPTGVRDEAASSGKPRTAREGSGTTFSRGMAKSRLHGWLKLEEEPALTAPCDYVPSTQRSTESHRPIYISNTGVTWLGKPCPRPHDQMMHDMQREAGIYAKRSNSFARWSTPRVVRQLGEYTTDAVGASMENWDMLQGAAADGTPSDVRRALDAHSVVFRAKGQGPKAWIDSTDDNGRTALMLAVIREIACHKSSHFS